MRPYLILSTPTWVDAFYKKYLDYKNKKIVEMWKNIEKQIMNKYYNYRRIWTNY